jgi:hypothetical protein
MPQVIAEDEEGACHSEAEAGVIFSGKSDTFVFKKISWLNNMLPI